MSDRAEMLPNDSQYRRPVPEQLQPVWWTENFISRLQSCRVMLALHGILTDSENERCKKRIAKTSQQVVKISGVRF